MSRTIAFIMGLWVMYCIQVDDYVGGLFILFTYVLTLILDPFNLKEKNASAANTDAQNK